MNFYKGLHTTPERRTAIAEMSERKWVSGKCLIGDPGPGVPAADGSKNDNAQVHLDHGEQGEPGALPVRERGDNYVQGGGDGVPKVEDGGLPPAVAIGGGLEVQGSVASKGGRSPQQGLVPVPPLKTARKKALKEKWILKK